MRVDESGFWLCRSSLEAHRIDRVGVDIRAWIRRCSRAQAARPSPGVKEQAQALSPPCNPRPRSVLNNVAVRPQIPRGTDVVNAVFGFAKHKNVGLCVLTASGTITNVSLRQPSFTPEGGGAVINFHGRFDLLLISATFIPPLSSTNSFTISLAGPQGQIIGGSVVGALAAVGTIFLVTASFDANSYYRLPIEEEMLDAVVSPIVVSGASDESHNHHNRHSSNVRSDQYRRMCHAVVK
ncbi:hypothetical protein Syun_003751 [Stephania yunnanensis]|uniref:PPC domain-containing protein n=1 Tax=Stephania yunnanensis TaxID=152371 RepID=A0AAP0Q1X0_9MAGN